MCTGMKNIDKLISRYGIRLDKGRDVSQCLQVLQGGTADSIGMHVPYCIWRIVESAPQHVNFKLHTWYLPHRSARLASFLIDEQGDVIEQVYFQRDANYVKACKKLQILVSEAQKKATQRHVIAA